MSVRFEGFGPALVTPMQPDGSVDLAAFEAHVDFVVEGGASFLVPCGTTGESATLSEAEQLAVIEACLRAADGRVPVMAGAGTNATSVAARRARDAVAVGADGVLSVAPYYNKPTQDGLHHHFMKVADAAAAPVCVYNVPGRTSVNVAADTVLRLAEAHEMITSVKEASGDLGQVTDILRGRPDGFSVLSGEDDLTLAVLALGGDGVISVVGNEAPASMAALVRAARDGDLDTARELHYRLLPLMRANFLETNPIPVKAALELMGRGEARYRLPLVPLSPGLVADLEAALEHAGVALPPSGRDT